MNLSTELELLIDEPASAGELLAALAIAIALVTAVCAVTGFLVSTAYPF